MLLRMPLPRILRFTYSARNIVEGFRAQDDAALDFRGPKHANIQSQMAVMIMEE
jgi:hypothetical protein